MKNKYFISFLVGVVVAIGVVFLCFRLHPASVVSGSGHTSEVVRTECRQSIVIAGQELLSEQTTSIPEGSSLVIAHPTQISLPPNNYPAQAVSRINQIRPEDLELIYAFIQNPNPPRGASSEQADSIKDQLLRQLDDINPAGYLEFLESLLVIPPSVNDVMKHYALQHLSVTAQRHPGNPWICQKIRLLLLNTIEAQSQTSIGGTALLALKRLAVEDDYEELATYAHIYLNDRQTHPSSRCAAYAVMGELKRNDVIHLAKIDAAQSDSLMLKLASTHYLSTTQHGETP